MTDEGVVTTDEEDDNDETTVAKPVKPKTQQRKVPESEVIDKPVAANNSVNNEPRNARVSTNRLVATPVAQLPPLPE